VDAHTCAHRHSPSPSAAMAALRSALPRPGRHTKPLLAPRRLPQLVPHRPACSPPLRGDGPDPGQPVGHLPPRPANLATARPERKPAASEQTLRSSRLQKRPSDGPGAETRQAKGRSTNGTHLLGKSQGSREKEGSPKENSGSARITRRSQCKAWAEGRVRLPRRGAAPARGPGLRPGREQSSRARWGRTDTLATEECQQKSWGLGEKSHTILGRCTECLSSNTLSLKLLRLTSTSSSHPHQKHDLKLRNLTLQRLRQSF